MEEYIEEFVKSIIKENKDLFSTNEINCIKNNPNIIKKVYLMGVKNGLEISV